MVISTFPDISSCTAIVLTAKSPSSYSGFRLSFGEKRGPCSRYGRGFKAHFDAPLSTEFQQVSLPLSAFSSCNNDATGNTLTTCAANAAYCPDLATLTDI